jgi:hypothetical protein
MVDGPREVATDAAVMNDRRDLDRREKEHNETDYREQQESGRSRGDRTK